MTKSDMVTLTLKELSKRLKSDPECFEYVGLDCVETTNHILPFENIIWWTKIDSNGQLIDDPTKQPQTIIVTFSHVEKSISVRIFNKTYPSLGMVDGRLPDAHIQQKSELIYCTMNYYRFNKMKNRILIKYRQNENASFLRKLISIFPNALDDHLLGE